MYVTVSSSLGFWISWNVVSSSSSDSLVSISTRCCWRNSCALLRTFSRKSRLTRSDCLSCSPPKACVDSTCHASFSPIDSFAVTLKFVFSCAFSTICDSTRAVSLDSVRRVCSWSSSSFVARVFLVTLRVV